jgi:linoleoyl-CoA desaturase
MEHKIFFSTLKNRVNQLFIDHDISPKGNRELYIKTVFWLGLWFALYIFLLLPFFPGMVKLYILSPLLGIASAGIGFNIMHDASHGAYAEKKNQQLNTLLSFTLELVGPVSSLWLIKHVFIHHSLVNTQHDDDIETGGLMRMSPHQERKWFHRYQHLYRTSFVWAPRFSVDLHSRFQKVL